MEEIVALAVQDEEIVVFTEKQYDVLDNVPKSTLSEVNNGFLYRLPSIPNNAYLAVLVARGKKVRSKPETSSTLRKLLKEYKKPIVDLNEAKTHLEIRVPLLPHYKNLMTKVGAWPIYNSVGHYRLPVSKFMSFDGLNKMKDNPLPPIKYSPNVQNLQEAPIPGFDGMIESLREIPLNTLNIISANGQNRTALRKNAKTLEEKFALQGISNLYDLLFNFPRRYIDKTNPQVISDLLEGESATIIGRIVQVTEMKNNAGIFFIVATAENDSIRSTFWRQSWLKVKFRVGDEVIITGRVNFWMNEPQLNGISIDHAEEATILPIVPIYRQSVSRGVNTYLIMAAQRELLDRLGKVNLPEYFKKDERENFDRILEQMHFPESLDYKDEAIDDYAYYELVYMQLLLEAEKQALGGVSGISQVDSGRSLQEKAISSLPFDLTGSQSKAIERINTLLADDKASTSLLNAEVGSGKTIVAQLACLRAVEAGYQAVLIGPTEILAKQLYDTFVKVAKNLEETTGEIVRIAFYSSSLKAVEKRELLKDLKGGEIDVLVGTHAVMGKTVKYDNLGLIVIDEQQKFGTEQREALLSARSDGRVPDLLMQTATPIPRSIAQIFYGDTEMITLPDRPPGRKPIVTEWVEENPQEVIYELHSPMWSDVVNEAEKGNQTFIITPLVQDSDKVDAASVERTFKTLQEYSLSGLKVGMVHGKMKKEEQAEIMNDFREGNYDVLVASTVVEVGVDVSTATRVIILSADRLGASSIWQVRGRVGRSDLQSKCYLVSQGLNENSRERLQSIVDAENGFDVAKSDLSLRGEGTIFSSNQSGKSDMIIASLASHGDLVVGARDEAKRIIDSKFREQAILDAERKFIE